MERKRAEEEARRREEDAKRDAEREEARRRAEADTQLKVRYYEVNTRLPNCSLDSSHRCTERQQVLRCNTQPVAPAHHERKNKTTLFAHVVCITHEGMLPEG